MEKIDFVQGLILKDEKQRTRHYLKKTRSDQEVLEFRNQIDGLYNNLIAKYSEYLDTYSENLLSPKEDMYDDINIVHYHTLLDNFLFFPHSFSIVIDSLTNHKGDYEDIGKFCNLFAIGGCVLWNLTNKAAKKGSIESAQMLMSDFIKEFENLNFGAAPFSEKGLPSCYFFYWLLYDYVSCNINLDPLIRLSKIAEGDIETLKMHLIVYWTTRLAHPKNTAEYYFQNVFH